MFATLRFQRAVVQFGGIEDGDIAFGLVELIGNFLSVASYWSDFGGRWWLELVVGDDAVHMHHFSSILVTLLES